MSNYDCDAQYKELVKRVLTEGEERKDRTGTGTISVFGGQMKFDLRERFPLVQCKETRYKVAFLEMLFFIAGETNSKWLNERGSTLWDAWSDKNGNLGPVYGFNWRKWGSPVESIPQKTPKLREGALPTKLGVANGDGGRGNPLHSVWANMVSRCYDPGDSQYEAYGMRGVSVCDEWLEFKKFEVDAKNLPGFRGPKPSDFKLDLDKDTLGSGFLYSPDTCQWINEAENRRFNKMKWEYEFEDVVTGERFVTRNAHEFAKSRGIKSFGGFSALWNDPRSSVRQGLKLIRRELVHQGVDQVKQVIEGVKNNPHGRRHIVTAWNVGELNEMALPPCHWAHQLYATNDGHLDMMVMQRSWDIGLGASFNIAQYALLLHLYARATGRKPRYMTYTYGDAHLYKDHVEAMREVIERPAIEDNAQIVFLTDNTDIDGYKPEDFKIEGYKSHSFVKLPVSV